MANTPLPYFDFLLAQLATHNPAVEKSFGRHVHWGYWPEPAEARCDDEDYAEAAERLTLELCAMAEVRAGDRVLDAGCGFGGTLASLNERLGGMDLAGLNIDGRQLERARRQVIPLGDNRVSFCQGDACRLPFADGSFDRLLAVECIFHFPSREQFFAEACRVLRPGGTLALSDFVPAPLLLPSVAVLERSRRFARFNYFGQCNLRYTLGRYRRLAAAAGLVPLAQRNVTANILPTYRYLRALVARKAPAKGYAGKAGYLIDLLRYLGTLRLLNYCLLSYRKP